MQASGAPISGAIGSSSRPHRGGRTQTLRALDGARSLPSRMATTQAAADAARRRDPARTSWRVPALTWVDLVFVLALVGVTAALRATRLPAPGLWFDDAFVGLVTKADTFEEIRLVGLTSPGYGFLLKGWLSLFGFTELNAQLPALVLGIATPPLAYGLLVWKGVHRLAAGTGALLLAFSAVHIRYSDRVKQFTLDGIVSLGLIAVFWWLLDDVRSARRWGWAGVAAVGAVVLATPSLVLVMAGFGVAWCVLLVRHRSSFRVALLPTVLAGVFSLAWLTLVLMPATNPRLRDFWAGYYIPVGDGLTSALDHTALRLERLIERAVELPTITAVVLVVLSALVVLLRRPVLGLLLVIPVPIAVVLAASQAAPLGGGRVDIYLYPGLAVMVALALDEVAGISRLALAAICAVLVGLFALSYSSPGGYPQQDLEPLVAHVQREASPSDGILVYPHASFGFGLYTTWPVDLERSEAWATGFDVRVDRPNVYVPATPSRTPEAAAAAVREATRSHDRVWFVVAQETGDSIRAYEEAFRSLGYSKSSELRRPGATLTLWTRT
jgi:hypothetical protein